MRKIKPKMRKAKILITLLATALAFESDPGRKLPYGTYQIVDHLNQLCDGFGPKCWTAYNSEITTVKSLKYIEYDNLQEFSSTNNPTMTWAYHMADVCTFNLRIQTKDTALRNNPNYRISPHYFIMKTLQKNRDTQGAKGMNCEPWYHRERSFEEFTVSDRRAYRLDAFDWDWLAYWEGSSNKLCNLTYYENVNLDDKKSWLYSITKVKVHNPTSFIYSRLKFLVERLGLFYAVIPVSETLLDAMYPDDMKTIVYQPDEKIVGYDGATVWGLREDANGKLYAGIYYRGGWWPYAFYFWMPVEYLVEGSIAYCAMDTYQF